MAAAIAAAEDEGGACRRAGAGPVPLDVTSGYVPTFPAFEVGK